MSIGEKAFAGVILVLIVGLIALNWIAHGWLGGLAVAASFSLAFLVQMIFSKISQRR